MDTVDKEAQANARRFAKRVRRRAIKRALASHMSAKHVVEGLDAIDFNYYWGDSAAGEVMEVFIEQSEEAEEDAGHARPKNIMAELEELEEWVTDHADVAAPVGLAMAAKLHEIACWIECYRADNPEEVRSKAATANTEAAPVAAE